MHHYGNFYTEYPLLYVTKLKHKKTKIKTYTEYNNIYIYKNILIFIESQNKIINAHKMIYLWIRNGSYILVPTTIVSPVQILRCLRRRNIYWYLKEHNLVEAALSEVKGKILSFFFP